MNDQVLQFTDANFDTEVLKSELPVLVDFWAPWCGPCRALAPTIDELAVENAGKVKVGKVNCDENDQTPMKYKIRGIPALLLFKGGEVAETMVGFRGNAKDEIQAMIDKA